MTASEVATVGGLLGRDVAVVATRHFGVQRGRNSLVRRALAPVARRLDAQIAVSDYVARHIDGASVVVRPGVPDHVSPTPYAARDRVVLVAQRLETEKHTADAVDAFARSGLAASGWTLEVAGAGAEATRLRRRADEAGVGHSARWLGHRTDVADLMQRSRILMATCPAEHFGLTVVEAMSCELPVVAVGSAGHLETVGLVEGAALYATGGCAPGGRLALCRWRSTRPDLPTTPDGWGRNSAAHSVSSVSASRSTQSTRPSYDRPRRQLARGLGLGVAAQPAPGGRPARDATPTCACSSSSRRPTRCTRGWAATDHGADEAFVRTTETAYVKGHLWLLEPTKWLPRRLDRRSDKRWARQVRARGTGSRDA